MEDNIEMNNEIVDNFDSENSAIEENHNNPGNNNNNFQYNIHDYENEVIYNKLASMHLLIKVYICPKCGKNMKIANDKASIDNKVWRCRSKNPNHYNKISIRVNQFLKELK